MEKFNPLTVKIEGLNLVEASAGTGKTYNIAALFARLIVIEKFNIDEILVVTFTRLATAELKTRLRSRLRDVMLLLEKLEMKQEHQLLQELEDPFLQELSLLLLQDPSQIIERKKHVQVALNNFDCAVIETIHGFCTRVLHDEAFLCSTPTNIELNTDMEQLWLQLVGDFWRKHITSNSALSTWCCVKKITPESLFNNINKYLQRPYLHLPDLQDYAQNYSTNMQAFEQAWADARLQYKTLYNYYLNELLPVLKGTSYNLTSRFFKQFWDSLSNPWAYNQDIINGLINNKFDQDEMRTKLKKDQNLPEDFQIKWQPIQNLSDCIKKLISTENTLLSNISLHCLKEVNQIWLAEKQKHALRGYNDLLIDVENALQGENANTLIERLNSKYKVVLIDEFQDTDPIQYTIFSQAFIGQDKARAVFLVGDPKQAIYRFRGADIFTYLKACKMCHYRYTLATNFRSNERLVNIFNILFSYNPEVFVLDNIQYIKVNAKKDAKGDTRFSKLSALNIRLVEKAGQDSKEQQLAQACAEDIVNLLNKNKQVCTSDIAVLVNKHHEAKLVTQALAERQVKSIHLNGQNYIFHEPEAWALYAILSFWIKPQDTSLLQFILSGELYRYTAKECIQFKHNEFKINQLIDQAQRAYHIWSGRGGLYSACQYFFKESGLEQRLLQHNNERSITNLTQLIELLTIESQNYQEVDALMVWFINRINNQNTHNSIDEERLRLESDSKLVKILTVHSSKGLQFPVVFFPFLPSSEEVKVNTQKDKIYELHNDNEECYLTFNLTEDEALKVNNEALAESMRLLYVALTRAKESLYLYSIFDEDDKGKLIPNTLSCLLNYQTHSENKTSAKTLWMQWYNQSNLPQDTVQLEVFTATSPTLYQPDHTTKTIQNQNLVALSFDQQYTPVQYSSFSQLMNNIYYHEDTEEQMEVLDLAERASAENTASLVLVRSLHQYPKGTQTGLCWHTILEHFDFTISAGNQQELIQEIMSKPNYQPKDGSDITMWLPEIVRMCDTIAKMSLDLDTHFCLADLPDDCRLTELEFLIPANLKKSILFDWLAEYLPKTLFQQIKSSDFSVQGYLKGFIDLVAIDKPHQKIYIIDYKSNFLGDQDIDYQKNYIEQSILEHHYYLQAVIYALAVHRYLNIYNVSFESISIRYLFLRGLNLEGTSGVWSWDIRREDLEKLNQKLFD